MSGTLGKSSARVGISVLAVSLISLVLGLAIRTSARPATTQGDIGTGLLILAGVTYVWFWFWVIIAIGNIAENKGYSKAGFIIFAIFLPLIALVVALVIQPSRVKQTAVAAAAMVKCPMCAELIQPDARKCKHCGSDVSTNS